MNVKPVGFSTSVEFRQRITYIYTLMGYLELGLGDLKITSEALL